MLFRNLTLFRVPAGPDTPLREILQRDPAADAGNPPDAWSFGGYLSECAWRPVGPLEMSTQGFIEPIQGTIGFTRTLDWATWLTVGVQTKLLPGSVINARLAEKIAEVEAREGRRIGGKARKQLKDDLIHELLPQAFVKMARHDALLLAKDDLFVVDTSNRKVAEGVASEVRRALGSFPAMPINAQIDPRSVLTGWLAGEPLPDGLSLGEAAILRDPVDGGARVRVDAQELRSDEIARHLEAGKVCTRLELALDDRLSFDLDETLQVRRLRFLEAAWESLGETEHDDLAAELDARFALCAGEISTLFHRVLVPAFNVSGVEG